MSTICKLALGGSSDHVLEALKSFFAARSTEFTITQSEWPEASERDVFRSGYDFPTVFSTRMVTETITEIHFNSFSNVQNLASFLSQALQTPVVVNVYQSTSTASYWALHTAGSLVRSIEAGDGEIHAQTGAKLPFERAEPEANIGEDGDVFFTFDEAAQNWYNREVGVPITMYQEYESGWMNLRLPESPPPPPSQRRKWWQFWRQHERTR